MPLTHKCFNGRSLLISHRENVIQDIETGDITPSVVLITAWNAEDVSSGQRLIQKLMVKGCNYFVCAGLLAEHLHDFVDEVVEAMGSPLADITTTYHDDEPADVVVNFFVNTTEISGIHGGRLVAILNKASPEDSVITELLLKS